MFESRAGEHCIKSLESGVEGEMFFSNRSLVPTHSKPTFTPTNSHSDNVLPHKRKHDEILNTSIRPSCDESQPIRTSTEVNSVALSNSIQGSVNCSSSLMSLYYKYIEAAFVRCNNITYLRTPAFPRKEHLVTGDEEKALSPRTNELTILTSGADDACHRKHLQSVLWYDQAPRRPRKQPTSRKPRQSLIAVSTTSTANTKTSTISLSTISACTTRTVSTSSISTSTNSTSIFRTFDINPTPTNTKTGTASTTAPSVLATSTANCSTITSRTHNTQTQHISPAEKFIVLTAIKARFYGLPTPWIKLSHTLHQPVAWCEGRYESTLFEFVDAFTVYQDYRIYNLALKDNVAVWVWLDNNLRKESGECKARWDEYLSKMEAISV